MEIVIQPNADLAAEFVAWLIAGQLSENPRSVLGLATGRTMESVYQKLVHRHLSDGLDFSNCRTFNLDEYVGIAAEDPRSYRHYMNEHLFLKVNINVQNTHLPNGIAADLAAECSSYEQLIAESGGIDLQLLGIGSNGHLGFNEPLSAIRSRTRISALAPETIEQNAVFFGGAEKMPRRAITMGLGTILDCRRLVLLATGADKASILAQAVEGPITSMIPGTALQLHPDCVVVVDATAGSELKEAAHYEMLFENEPKWEPFRQRTIAGQGASQTIAPKQPNDNARSMQV